MKMFILFILIITFLTVQTTSNMIINDDLTGWNINTKTMCGNQELLGGFNVLGGGKKLIKTYPFDYSGCNVNIKFNFMKIDSWDNESLVVRVNDNIVYQQVYNIYQGTQICGKLHGGWNEEIHAINIDTTISTNVLVLDISTTLNQPGWDESWGINDVVITTSSCGTKTPPDNAVVCPTGYDYSHDGYWSNYDNPITNVNTLDQCGNTCTSTSTCIGFSYYFPNNCFHYTSFSDQINHSGSMACKKVSDEECPNGFIYSHHGYLSVNRYTTVPSIITHTLDKCASLCTGHCKSFSFNYSTGKCSLYNTRKFSGTINQDDALNCRKILDHVSCPPEYYYTHHGYWSNYSATSVVRISDTIESCGQTCRGTCIGFSFHLPHYCYHYTSFTDTVYKAGAMACKKHDGTRRRCELVPDNNYDCNLCGDSKDEWQSSFFTGSSGDSEIYYEDYDCGMKNCPHSQTILDNMEHGSNCEADSEVWSTGEYWYLCRDHGTCPITDNILSLHMTGGWYGKFPLNTSNINNCNGQFDIYKVQCIEAGEGILISWAQYGSNCNGSIETKNLGNACNGLTSCSYTVDHNIIGDPCYGISKKYEVEYYCNGTLYYAHLDPEASGKTITLSCPNGTTGRRLLKMFSDE